MRDAGRLQRIAALAAEWAAPFGAQDWPLLQRDISVGERRPGWSVNGNSRMVKAADGWMAVTLAREEDRAGVAAWLEGDASEAPWAAVERLMPRRDCAMLIERATWLGLPVARLGEVAAGGEAVAVLHWRGGVARDGTRLRVVDISALWAGPLCAGLLGEWGADVVRVESLSRPDPTPQTSPLLDARINGGKRRLALDLTREDGRAALADLIVGADVLVTSARARGLAGLGLRPDAVFAANPALIWVAVTGHGWASDRVGFGDDAAVAGGLVSDGPDFLGDALADPLTGVLAARTALAMLEAGEAGLVDAALARCAAHVAELVA